MTTSTDALLQRAELAILKKQADIAETYLLAAWKQAFLTKDIRSAKIADTIDTLRKIRFSQIIGN